MAPALLRSGAGAAYFLLVEVLCAVFSAPTFNLVSNVWHWASWVGVAPPAVAPDVVVMGNLRMLKTAFVNSAAEGYGANMLLALPMLTDVRGYQGWGGTLGQPDLVEVPAGTGRFYVVVVVDDVAKGFPNEYRNCLVEQWSQVAPIPIP